MVAQGFTVDLHKPIVHQVGFLGDEYEEWVHQPIVTKEGPRFYEGDFSESLSKTVWWAVPLIWLPVVSWCIFSSYQMGHSILEVALMVLFGLFFWTLFEYILHRFLFHMGTTSHWGNTIHYVVHGFHHKHPMDGLRLVFPPAGTAIISIPVWYLIRVLTSPSSTPALYGGVLFGYVMYDITHYYLHHAKPSSRFGRNLKIYHLNHHFRIQNMGFGVTSPFWDWVFGTLPPQTNAAAKSQ